MQFKPSLFRTMRHQYRFASDSSFIFFFFSLTHHLFYLYIHQLFLFLSNLHHYLRFLPPVVLHPSSPPLLSPFTTLVGFSIVFHAIPNSKVISDTQFVNNSGMQETNNSTELGHTRQSIELHGKLELQILSNF